MVASKAVKPAFLTTGPISHTASELAPSETANADLQKLVCQKLQFLVAEDCLLIVGDENYNSFYNMVQNEVKLNGKEKMLKLLNSLLDQNIRQIKKKAPGRFSNSVPPPQTPALPQKSLPPVK